MKKIITILLIGIFTSCSALKEQKISNYNYFIVKNKYPNHKIKEFKRFSYIKVVYNGKDSLKLWINSQGAIYKTKKLK